MNSSFTFHAITKNMKTMLGVNNLAGIVTAIRIPMLFISKKSQELFVTAFRKGFNSINPTFVAITVMPKSRRIRNMNIARIRKSNE